MSSGACKSGDQAGPACVRVMRRCLLYDGACSWPHMHGAGGCMVLAISGLETRLELSGVLCTDNRITAGSFMVHKFARMWN